MSLHYKTEGFVFRKNDRSDNDRSFSIFTKDFGRIEVFAKALRKIASKLKSGIEIFYFSEIEFVQGKNKKTLTDAVCIHKFEEVYRSAPKLEAAYQIAKVLGDFITGQERDEKIYSLIADIFGKLSDWRGKDNQLVIQYFFWNFVVLLGHGPELSRCAICSKKLSPHNLFFSNKEGGVVCQVCSASDREVIAVTAEAVKILRLILQQNWQTVSKLKIDDSCQKLLRKVFDGYYQYLLEEYSFKKGLKEV